MLFDGIWGTLGSVFADFSKNGCSLQWAFFSGATKAHVTPQAGEALSAGVPLVIQINCFVGE